MIKTLCAHVNFIEVCDTAWFKQGSTHMRMDWVQLQVIGVLSFLQFLRLQNSCLATAKVVLLDVDQCTVITALLLQSA